MGRALEVVVVIAVPDGEGGRGCGLGVGGGARRRRWPRREPGLRRHRLVEGEGEESSENWEVKFLVEAF